ncbi:MAG TPA: hypothetical protein V6C88_10815 [Chroococcidiopsis sp.]
MDNNQPCLYQRGQTRLITLLKDGLCIFCGETLEALMIEHPEAEVMPFSEALEFIEQAHQEQTRQAPKRIDRARFDEMLNVLPPMKWRSDSGSESFMLSEATSSHYHLILCRIGANYYQLTDSRLLNHQQIVALCLALESND